MALLALAVGAHAEDCVRTVRSFHDPPYSITNGNGVHGIDADLVSEALRRVGCKAEFRELPWARALIELEAGRLDLLPNALVTAERKRFALFSRAYSTSRNVLFVSAQAGQRFGLKQLADIAGTEFRLGVQPKASYGVAYDELLADPRFAGRLVPVTHLKGALEMLDAGRIDGVLADEFTGFEILRELGLERGTTIRHSGIVVGTDAASVAFSRKSVKPDFVEAFDRALESMLADGSYVRILETYLPCKVTAAALGCE